MNLKQLYGQTEAFLYLTAQPDGEIYSDTVGPALPNVDIRIADNGEVQFKSPGMFVSYFKDDAKTKETMTPDGYVKTGDAGFFDSKTGHLKIIDRAKDVGKLKDGTLFPPKYIENKLKFFPEHPRGGGLRRRPRFRRRDDQHRSHRGRKLGRAQQRGLWLLPGAGRPSAGLRHDREEHRGDQPLARRGQGTAGAQIKRFLILHKELDADDGEMTRTQKVRRGFVAERYAPLINALYDGSTEADISTEVTFEDGRKGMLAGA